MLRLRSALLPCLSTVASTTPHASLNIARRAQTGNQPRTERDSVRVSLLPHRCRTPMPPPRPAPCFRLSPTPSPGRHGHHRGLPEFHHQGPPGTHDPQPEDRRSRRHRRLASAVVQGREDSSRRGQNGQCTGPVESPVPAAPMSSNKYCRAWRREQRFATDAREYAGSDFPVLPHRLRPVDHRAGPHCHRRLAMPFCAMCFRAGVGSVAPGFRHVWGRDDHPRPEPVVMEAAP